MRLLLALAIVIAAHGSARAATLPEGFVDEVVLSGLASPASLVFAPDGRMFVGERISGRLLVAHRSSGGVPTWALNAEAFHSFDVPASAHRSSGLRDLAFDPDFANQPYLYVFYMKSTPRQNRLVRIRASLANPDLSAPATETLLLEMPFTSIGSSGSHNGGAVEVGSDGYLYVTTGDGWSGADPVQSLETFTGKAFRIGRDGSIPGDNPFRDATTGDLRAIYALGLRNPYALSRHPATGALYVNDAVGSGKAEIRLLEAGANYGHPSGSAIGTPRGSWANASAAGGYLVTGGAWYPDRGAFPEPYRSSYYATLWGTNSGEPGDIARIADGPSPTVSLFARDVSAADGGSNSVKPVLTRVGPDGHLYYLLTDYETGAGAVHRIRHASSIFHDGFETGSAGAWAAAR